MSKREKEKLNAVMLQIASHSGTPRGNDQSIEDKKSPKCEDVSDDKQLANNCLPSPKLSPTDGFTKNTLNEVDSSCSPRSFKPPVSHPSVDVRQDIGGGVVADSATPSRYSPHHESKPPLLRSGNLPLVSPVSTIATGMHPSITSANVAHRVTVSHAPVSSGGMNRYSSYGSKQSMMSSISGGDSQPVQLSHPLPVLSGKTPVKNSMSPVHQMPNGYTQRGQVSDIPSFATNNGHIHPRNGSHDPVPTTHPGTSQRALEHLLSQQSVLGHNQNYKTNFMLHNGSSYDVNGSVSHTDRKPPLNSVSLATLFEYQMRQAIVESNKTPNGQKFPHMPANCLPLSEPTNGYDKSSLVLRGPIKRSLSPVEADITQNKFCKVDKTPATSNSTCEEACGRYFTCMSQPKSEIVNCNSNTPAYKSNSDSITYVNQDSRECAMEKSVTGVITASRQLSSVNSETFWKPCREGKPPSFEDSKTFLRDSLSARQPLPHLPESDKKLMSPVSSKELLKRIEMVDSLTKVYCLEMDSQRRCLEGILHVIITQHMSGENEKVSTGTTRCNFKIPSRSVEQGWRDVLFFTL